MAANILKILDELEPSVRDAFLTAVADIKSSAQLSVIAGALDRGDIEAALHALNLRAEFFAPLDDALRAAYLQGGADALAGLPRIPDPFQVAALWRGLTGETPAPKRGSRNGPAD